MKPRNELLNETNETAPHGKITVNNQQLPSRSNRGDVERFWVRKMILRCRTADSHFQANATAIPDSRARNDLVKTGLVK